MRIVLLPVVVFLGCGVDDNVDEVEASQSALKVEKFSNPFGKAGSVHTSGKINFSNPFFVPQTANGRSCKSCHDPATGWTITPAGLAVFESGNGNGNSNGQPDPLFNVLEMAVCPNGECPAAQNLTTEQRRRAAFKTALARGTATFATTIPVIRDANGAVLPPEIVVEQVVDPFGYSTTTRFTRYRRPLPTVNLGLISTMGWVGSTSVAPVADAARDRTALRTQLMNTFNNATKFHGQSTLDVPVEARAAVADLLLGLYSAQLQGTQVGQLDTAGATGGPEALAQLDFYERANDNFGRDPLTGSFDQAVFDPFDAWAGGNAHRAAIARGQAIFNHRAFSISGVAGINDVPIPDTALTRSLGIANSVLPAIPAIPGVTACSTCHDSPNAGSRSAFGAVDIGIADCNRVDGKTDPTLQVKLFLLNPATGARRCVTDIGRAQLTGRWADIGKFKGPTLRALAARSHYFHDGSAPALEDVVQFYNLRFGIGLTTQDKADLVAFLRSL